MFFFYVLLVVVVLGLLFFFVSAAMFSKPCLFVLGFCTKFRVNHCREDYSEEIMKNSEIDNLPVILLGLILCVFWCFMGILVKRRNHKHKSYGNQSKAMVIIWL